MQIFERSVILQTPVLLALLVFVIALAAKFFPHGRRSLGILIVILQIICLTGLTRAPMNYAGSHEGFLLYYSDLVLSDFLMFLILALGAYATMIALRGFYFVERSVAVISLLLFGYTTFSTF
jgi:hypothetical protein